MRVSRLFILVRDENGLRWLPKALSTIVGTDWDHRIWRTIYRARKVCTAWINDEQEREVKIEARHAAIKARAA